MSLTHSLWKNKTIKSDDFVLAINFRFSCLIVVSFCHIRRLHQIKKMPKKRKKKTWMEKKDQILYSLVEILFCHRRGNKRLENCFISKGILLKGFFKRLFAQSFALLYSPFRSSFEYGMNDSFLSDNETNDIIWKTKKKIRKSKL